MEGEHHLDRSKRRDLVITVIPKAAAADPATAGGLILEKCNISPHALPIPRDVTRLQRSAFFSLGMTLRGKEKRVYVLTLLALTERPYKGELRSSRRATRPPYRVHL